MEETKVTPTPAPAAEPVKPEAPVAKKTIFGHVTGCDKLNVRTKPSLKAPVAKVIDKAAKVTIDEEFNNAAWYKVTVDNVTGFCMKAYIKQDK